MKYTNATIERKDVNLHNFLAAVWNPNGDVSESKIFMTAAEAGEWVDLKLKEEA